MKECYIPEAPTSNRPSSECQAATLPCRQRMTPFCARQTPQELALLAAVRTDASSAGASDKAESSRLARRATKRLLLSAPRHRALLICQQNERGPSVQADNRGPSTARAAPALNKPSRQSSGPLTTKITAQLRSEAASGGQIAACAGDGASMQEAWKVIHPLRRESASAEAPAGGSYCNPSPYPAGTQAPGLRSRDSRGRP